MHVHRHGDSWRYEFRAGTKRYRRAGFPTKTLARAAGEVEQDRVKRGRIARIWGVRDSVERAKGIPTLDRYVAEVYAPLHLPRLAHDTQKTARSQLGKLTRGLGSTPLDLLDHAALDGYLSARMAEGVSGGQVSEEVTRLARVVNHAIGRGVIGELPFKGWKRPKRISRDYRVVTREEEARLMAAARGLAIPFDVPIRLALYAGLRKGEIRTLERSALVDGELRLRQPKTKRVKVVPLDPETWGMCSARTAATGRLPRVVVMGLEKSGGPQDAVVQRTGPRPGVDYLFPSPSGKPWSLPWIDAQWFRARNAAGIKGVRFHDLRHTFASRLADAGVGVPVVGELMGHTPPYTMTLRYFHVFADSKRAAILGLIAPPPRAPPWTEGQGRRAAESDGRSARCRTVADVARSPSTRSRNPSRKGPTSRP